MPRFGFLEPSMTSFDTCKQCNKSFNSGQNGVRVPIQGTCSCSISICRSCVGEIAIEQQGSQKANSDTIVSCPDCGKSAFQMDNLIINKSLCNAITAFRKVSDEIVRVVEEAPRPASIQPRRSARNQIPVAPVKDENSTKGYFKCPRGCKFSITASERACNVVTCIGDSYYRSETNPYEHPKYLYFCVHCKVECIDNYSTCNCPKKKDKETCERVLQEKNVNNWNNPIALSPVQLPQKPRKGYNTSTRKRKKVADTAADALLAELDQEKEQVKASAKTKKSKKNNKKERQAAREKEKEELAQKESDEKRKTANEKKKAAHTHVAQTPVEDSSNDESESERESEDYVPLVGGDMAPTPNFHPLRDIVTIWANESKAEILSDRKEMSMCLLFELLDLSRK